MSGKAAGGRITPLVRVLLVAGGLVLAGLMIWSAGVENVVTVVRRAGPWLPLVVLCEVGILATDFFASRTLVADKEGSVPASAWIRATALAYASAAVLPAGRAAGEAVRATTLSPSIGVRRAAGACSRLQACVLVANVVVSLVCAAVVAFTHPSTILVAGLVGNAVVCGALGVLLLEAVRSERLARWLKARFPNFIERHGTGEASVETRFQVTNATLLSVLGRAIQAAQLGIVLHAVGARVTAASAITAQGIQIVGAAIGDLLPNQMGATEGAYGLFKKALDLGDDPARAMSIILVVRLAQLGLSCVCFLVAMAAVRHLRSAEAR
jgi:hypothetical protein